MLKRVKLVGTVVGAVLMVIIIILAVVLNTKENYKVHGEYSTPVCMFDLKGFEEDGLCPQCGLSFLESGILLARNPDNGDIKFKEVYDSLSAYNKEHTFFQAVSVFFGIVILLLILDVVLVVRFICGYEKEKKR